MAKKSVFVLWSGGIDSTYLILRLLEDGFHVEAGYVNIRNNRLKTPMEKAALSKLAPAIREFFPSFKYEGVIYSASNNVGYQRGLKYKQLPYFLHAFLVAPHTDYRALGYVAGDSAIKNLGNITALYNSYGQVYNGKMPELVFPIRKTTKAEILAYMEANYKGIIEECVWCERPMGEHFKPCESCTPCRRRANEMLGAEVRSGSLMEDVAKLAEEVAL